MTGEIRKSIGPTGLPVWALPLLIILTVGLSLHFFADDNRQRLGASPPTVHSDLARHDAAQSESPSAGLSDLPEEQMRLIKRVFAPELEN